MNDYGEKKHPKEPSNPLGDHSMSVGWLLLNTITRAFLDTYRLCNFIAKHLIMPFSAHS
jgi:hypothetical protein